MIGAWLHAHRWVSTGLLALVLGLAGWQFGDEGVRLPLVEEPVPVRLLSMLAVTLIGLSPLYASFPELELTLPREPLLRVARVAVAAALAAIVALPAIAGATTSWDRHAELVLFALVLAAGVVAVVVLGETAWAVPLALGVFALIADGTASEPITRALRQVPTSLALLTLLVSAVLFVRCGPHRPRR